MKTEILLRARCVVSNLYGRSPSLSRVPRVHRKLLVHNYGWDVATLETTVLDYKPGTLVGLPPSLPRILCRILQPDARGGSGENCVHLALHPHCPVVPRFLLVWVAAAKQDNDSRLLSLLLPSPPSR